MRLACHKVACAAGPARASWPPYPFGDRSRTVQNGSERASHVTKRTLPYLGKYYIHAKLCNSPDDLHRGKL